MANPKIAAVESTVPKSVPSQPEQDENANTGSVFIEKAKELPMVNAVSEYATSTYNQVKQMNNVANYALSTAESTVLYCAMAAMPFFQKIKPQAKKVDEIAARGLEVLEANYSPVLHMKPEEVIDAARKLCATTLQTGYQKVEEVKNLGTGAISSVANYGMQKANDCLTTTEKLVDRVLPPILPQDEGANDLSVSGRAAELTNKIGSRVLAHTGKHFFQTLNLTRENCAKLDQLVQLMEYVHTHTEGKTLQERWDFAKQTSAWIVDELRKEEPANVDEAAKSLEQRMLSVARRISSGLVYTWSATVVPLAELPQTCTESIRTARNYAAELFTQFDQAVINGEAATAILERARGTISAFQGVITSMIDTVQPKENIEMEELSPKKSSSQEAAAEARGS